MPVSTLSPHPRLALLLPLLCLGALPTPLSAQPLESRGWLGVGGAAASPATPLSQWGPHVQLGTSLKFSTFFSVYGGLEGAYHLGLDDPPTPALWVHDLFVGLRYDLDILAYIPHMGLAAVAYTASPPTEALAGLAESGPPGAGLKLSIGLDWRPQRAWSLGGLIEVHTALSDLSAFSLYATVGLNLGYHWRW